MLSTKMDSFDDRMTGIEGKIRRIRRHQNIPISDAELKEELGEDDDEDLPEDE